MKKTHRFLLCNFDRIVTETWTLKFLEGKEEKVQRNVISLETGVRQRIAKNVALKMHVHFS